MRRQIAVLVAATAMLSGLTLVVPITAGASGTPSSTTTNPVKSHHGDVAAYRSARQAINQAFESAVLSAQTAFQIARNSASTAAARSTARAAFELALTRAAALRDQELTALGSPPTR